MKLPRQLLILTFLTATGVACAADAVTNWKEHCAKCHGEDGKGQTKMGKKLSIRDLSDATVQSKFSDEQALKALKEGVKDESGKQSMKPADGISDDEMKALIGYVRSLKK